MAAVKKGDTVVLVGTRKGLFLFHSRDRKRWSSRGPYFEGDTIRHAILDPDKGKTVFAGVTSEHWGPVVARSTDFGGKWSIPKEGPRFSKESGISVTKLWQLQKGPEDDLYVGVEPAGLFRSEDDGTTWASDDGVNYREGREKWEPGGRRPLPPHDPPVPGRFPAHARRHFGGGHLRDKGRRRVLVDVRCRDPLVRKAEALRPRGPQHLRPQDGPGPPGPRHRVPTEPRRHVPAHEGRSRMEDHRERPADFQEHGRRLRVPDCGPSARSRDRLCGASRRRLQPRDAGRRDGRDPHDGWREALDQDDEGASATGCVVYGPARGTSHGFE